MKVYLDCNYPKNLEEALKLIHALQNPSQIEIIRTQQFDETDINNTAVFLFDKSKKGLDIITEKHFQAGYKVFAFKFHSTNHIDLFRLSVVTLKFWPKILELITEKKEPFVFTYNYNGRSLNKVMGS
jgi:hypothetical protein